MFVPFSEKCVGLNVTIYANILKLQCEVNFNNDRNLTYSCVYTPTMEGEYRVIVKFAGKEIPKSPYKVNVDAMPGKHLFPLLLSAAQPRDPRLWFWPKLKMMGILQIM